MLFNSLSPRWYQPTSFARLLMLVTLVAVASGGILVARTAQAATSFVVTTVADTTDPNDGVTSLREAIIAANTDPDASTLTFELPGNGPHTINLTSVLPDLTQSVTITGPGANLLTIRRDTGGDYRIFHIPSEGLTITISGLTISNGLAPTFGGGIRSRSQLTLNDCHITNNQALGLGGGGVSLARSDGRFTNCTISNNTSSFQGGGINYQGDGNHTLTLQNCTISGNTANGDGYGGGIINISFSLTSTLQVSNCTIANNTSAGANGGGIFSEGVNSGNTGKTLLTNTILANNNAPNLVEFGMDGGMGMVTSQGYNLSSDNGNGLLTGPGDQINTDPQLDPLQEKGGSTPTHPLLPESPAINAGDPNFIPPPEFDQRGPGFPRVQQGRLDIGAVEGEFIPPAIKTPFATTRPTAPATPKVTITAPTATKPPKETITVPTATKPPPATPKVTITARTATATASPSEGATVTPTLPQTATPTATPIATPMAIGTATSTPPAPFIIYLPWVMR